ncbi:MAG: hypothetical protein SFY68_03030 [Candidatus Sumerlaeia bacterium]|nr:hypothetical protein [Candidatus Sumerlaeia bacterium]
MEHKPSLDFWITLLGIILFLVLIARPNFITPIEFEQTRSHRYYFNSLHENLNSYINESESNRAYLATFKDQEIPLQLLSKLEVSPSGILQLELNKLSSLERRLVSPFFWILVIYVIISFWFIWTSREDYLQKRFAKYTRYVFLGLFFLFGSLVSAIPQKYGIFSSDNPPLKPKIISHKGLVYLYLPKPIGNSGAIFDKLENLPYEGRFELLDYDPYDPTNGTIGISTIIRSSESVVE